MESDNEFLRTQIKMQDAPNTNFEKFYIQELEKKLEAHRSHEVKLTQEFQFAQKLVKDLQHENAEFLSREKELVSVTFIAVSLPPYSFYFSHMSEDNLRGLLQNTEEYLSRGQSATITISNIQIPDVPIGTKVSISLTAERDTRNKRSAQGKIYV